MFYSTVAKSISDNLIYLGKVVVENQQTILNIGNIVKKHPKGMISDEFSKLNLSIMLYNESLENLISFIRKSEEGFELEDLTLYLEKCFIRDITGAIHQNSFFQSNDIKEFQRQMSLANVKKMVRDICDIAFDDRNPSFLKEFTRTAIAS